MNIYCIHERTEIYAHRIAHFQKQLAEIDGDFDVVYVDSFPAFEFNKVNTSKFNQLHTANNSSEKSCFWKHYDALKKISKSNDVGLILEDDAIFHPSIISDCKKLLTSLYDEPNFYINVEYCSYDVPIWFLNKSLVKMKGTKRCGGYLVSQKAAKKICGFIDRYLNKNKEINDPSDTFVTNYWENIGINVFWAVKPLVWQGSKSGRFNSDLSFRKETFYYFLYEPITFYFMPIVNKIRACFRKKIKDRVIGYVK